jgi:CPA1 family monovalent cation:H+ antiporter
MAPLLDRLGVVTRSETEELYELLVGRERAVTAALEAADRLARRGDLPTTVHEDFIAEYEREQEALARATSELLERDPELRRERLLTGERRILRREKSALMDAVREGVVADDVGERLLDEVDLKLSRVDDGRSTAGARHEEYQDFGRARADAVGLDADAEEAEGGPDPVD